MCFFFVGRLKFFFRTRPAANWTIEGMNEWHKTAARLARALPTYHPHHLLLLLFLHLFLSSERQGTSWSCALLKVWNAEEGAIHEWVAFVRALTLSLSLILHCSHNITKYVCVCMCMAYSICKINGHICASGRSHSLESWNKTRAFCFAFFKMLH